MQALTAGSARISSSRPAGLVCHSSCFSQDLGVLGHSKHTKFNENTSIVVAAPPLVRLLQLLAAVVKIANRKQFAFIHCAQVVRYGPHTCTAAPLPPPGNTVRYGPMYSSPTTSEKPPPPPQPRTQTDTNLSSETSGRFVMKSRSSIPLVLARGTSVLADSTSALPIASSRDLKPSSARSSRTSSATN